MNQNYRRNRANRDQDNPGNKSQAAALGTDERSRQTRGGSQDASQDQAAKNAGRPGRGWDDLSPDTLDTDQTTRR